MQLVEKLKQAGEDFEFYPTTKEIIAALVRDITTQKWSHREGSLSSILDIGAGNGKVLRALRDAKHRRWEDSDSDEMRDLFHEFYAIEKSITLCQQLDAEIFIVGTDFTEQSLVSKKVDVTFCNPPYSEFTEWAVKIIRETASRLVYLVIPTRWEDSLEISAALKFRDAKTNIVGEFSFLHSEDRQARAKVHLLRIALSGEEDDAFDRFFDEHFAALKEKFESTRVKETKGEVKVDHTANPKFAQLVVGPSYPERLVELYNEEMDHVRKNYDLVAQLDADLLKEFDVTPDRILACLKARLAGLRNTYWQELLSNMSQVTNRLCSKKRQKLLEKLNESGHVDFTNNNIHAVVLWVLKNANNYLDEQLIETFENMVEGANVRNYKSNQRVFKYDRWRYNDEKPSHVALEYRLVISRCGGINKGHSWNNGLCETGSKFLGDLLTVARNLGFDCKDRSSVDRSNRSEWKSGETRVFHMKGSYAIGDKVTWTERTRRTITNKVQLENGSWQYCLGDDEWVHENVLPGEPLLEVRAFLNHNIHVRLNQKFALALNVEYGRLKGWLRNGAEAADELGDPEATQFFNSQVRLGASSLAMLGAPTC